jgi:hypothetical protein
MQDNYQAIAVKLANREAFRGNSMSAYWFDTDYQVLSYGTIIANYNSYECETWISANKYSVTTSRHQNLIKKAWGI